MATKTTPKTTPKTARTQDDRRDEAFRLRVESLDGLLRLAARLAGEMENAGVPPHLDGMDRELNAIWGVLPVLAGALSSYGPGHYDGTRDMDRPVADHLGHIRDMLKLAELTARPAVGVRP